MGEDESENLKNVEEVSLRVADEIRAAVEDMQNTAETAPPAEEDTKAVDAANGSFDAGKWSTCLTAVRLATLLLRRDDQEFEEVFSEIVAKSDAPDVLDAWCTAQEDLRDMIELLDTVLKRSFSVLERQGYSPDHLPPGRPRGAMHR
jgi:hypothetical protein